MKWDRQGQRISRAGSNLAHPPVTGGHAQTFETGIPVASCLACMKRLNAGTFFFYKYMADMTVASEHRQLTDRQKSVRLDQSCHSKVPKGMDTNMLLQNKQRNSLVAWDQGLDGFLKKTNAHKFMLHGYNRTFILALVHIWDLLWCMGVKHFYSKLSSRGNKTKTKRMLYWANYKPHQNQVKCTFNVQT